MKIDEAKVTVDERLSTAANSDDLDAGAEPRSDLDLLIAAGWTTQKADLVLGRCLIALESEWDATEQPRPPREHDIEAMARTLPELVEVWTRNAKGEAVALQVPRARAARHMAEEWYEAERKRAISRLKALEPARAALAIWAHSRSMQKPEGKALGMLAWWLDHRCPKCFGTKLTPLPAGGRGSTTVCKACAGLGERPLPYGMEGRQLERHLLEARRSAIDSVRTNIRISRKMRARYATFRNAG